MTPPDTRPFAPFEWIIAGRYLRARRKEGFISVIAGFSFLGITLGVATLISSKEVHRWPPETRRAWPVTQRASSEARKTATGPMSSG